MSIDLSSIKNTQFDSKVSKVETEINNVMPLDDLDDMNGLSLDLPFDQPPMKSKETLEAETEARIVLQIYHSKFPEELAILANELSYQSLMLMDLEGLKALRDKCDRILGGSSALENRKRAMNSFLYVIEKLSVYSGIECSGLTSTLLNDKDYQKDVMRLSLRYLSSSEMNPEWLVLSRIITTSVQLHANNEIKREQAAITQKMSQQNDNIAELKPNVANIDIKYKDL